MRNTLTIIILILFVSHASAARLDNLVTEAASAGSGEIPVIVFINKSATSGYAIAGSYHPTHIYPILGGFSSNLTASEIDSLSENPAIIAVYYDRVKSIAPFDGDYSIQLASSYDTVGAKYAHESLNITGRNITVAVIDTGINYSHPDLGGCFGIGCRVKGGYDFYDGDSDPDDVHGHGTHVAGIIGANGTIVGMAPEVQFLAYKVCSDDGLSCTDSAIIASIDHAIANGADIMSMSLGGKALPNDGSGATEYVIDQAVGLGVVMVSVSGNSGPGQSCIQAPGMATRIITVGGSNDANTASVADDSMMSMSCRGPSAFGRFDPELVAPGQSIISTDGDGSGLRSSSGTSMAAPHVSGAAALLLEQNNTLTPEQVSSALMHSASNFTGHAFERGAGLLNISRALLQTVDVIINNDDRLELSVIPGFNASVNLTFINNGNSIVSFNFSLESVTDLKNLNSLNTSNFVFPSNVSVTAGSSTTVKLNITVPSDATPATYGTTIIITTNDSQQLRVPVALTVPLFGDGVINGTLSNAGSYQTSSNSATGDTIYYQIRNLNGSALTVSLNWTSTSNDLDLYLFTPGGVTINSSSAETSEGEFTSLSRLDYDTYWVAVHAFTLTGTIAYNLTVSYTSNVSVSPLSWEGLISGNQNITFTVSNDAVPKNVSVDVVRQVIGSTIVWNQTGTLANATSSSLYQCYVSWFGADFNLTLNETRYVDLNLSWDTASNLDLYIWAWNDDGDLTYENGESVESIYYSNHENHQLNSSVEKITGADILYYSRQYYDVGAAVCNRDMNQSYNGTFTANITFYNISHWSPATLDSSQLNLAANQSANVTVSFNTTGLVESDFYVATFRVANYASIPLRLTVQNIVPAAPTLNSLAIILNNDTPTFSWNLTESDIDYYRLQVSNFSDFSVFGMNSGYNNQTTASNFSGGFLHDGLYFWRVRAVDLSSNIGNYSDIENFTVKTVFLNELMTTGTEWIELYNIMGKNYSLVNWTVGNSGGNYTLSETVTGSGYLVLYANVSNLTLADFNGTISLWNPNSLLADNISYSNVSVNYSFGRVSDGAGSWRLYESTQSTPGAANTLTLTISLLTGWNLISLPLTV